MFVDAGDQLVAGFVYVVMIFQYFSLQLSLVMRILNVLHELNVILSTTVKHLQFYFIFFADLL